MGRGEEGAQAERDRWEELKKVPKLSMIDGQRRRRCPS